MRLEIIFKSLYKICFFIFLSALALMVVSWCVLPHFSGVDSPGKYCYWRSGDISPYLVCEENAAYGKIVSFVLNWISFLLLLMFVPVFIIFLPPILIPFVLFFYLFVISYIFTKNRDPIKSRASLENNEAYYKRLRTSFIVLLAIAIPLQAYQSYKIHLVNAVYWKAKLGIANDVLANDTDYKVAVWKAVSKNEASIVALLFRQGHPENPRFLEEALDHNDYEIANFYLKNGVEVSQKSVEIIFKKIIDNHVCDDTENEHYKTLRHLLEKHGKPSSDLMRMAATSLCVPFIQELLRAGGSLDYKPKYRNPEKLTLLDFARVEITSGNTYNGWLHRRPQEEIENRRAQMIRLLSNYQRPEKNGEK